jgi:hypothetical protein
MYLGKIEPCRADIHRDGIFPTSRGYEREDENEWFRALGWDEWVVRGTLRWPYRLLPFDVHPYPLMNRSPGGRCRATAVGVGVELAVTPLQGRCLPSRRR